VNSEVMKVISEHYVDGNVRTVLSDTERNCRVPQTELLP